MTAYNFIKNNIGTRIYLLSDYDLDMNTTLRKFMLEYHNPPEKLFIKGLTNGGVAIVFDENNNEYKIAPSKIREYDKND